MIFGITQIPLKRTSYSYFVTANISDGISSDIGTLVVDTGSPALVHYNKPVYDEASGKYRYGESQCSFLGVDGSSANYTGTEVNDDKCYLNNDGAISLLTENGKLTNDATVAYTFAARFRTDNHKLHNWGRANGTMGISFCNDNHGNSCSSLESVIRAQTNNTEEDMVFGLDLGPTGGSMQINGISDEFAATIKWVPQTRMNPFYHEFMMERLQVCDVSIFGGKTNTWPAIIDTGVLCAM